MFHFQDILLGLKEEEDVRLKSVVAQFHLFVELCKGSHVESIEYLQGIKGHHKGIEQMKGIEENIGVKIDFQFLMYNIDNENCCDILKAKLIELLKGKCHLLSY